MVPFSIAGVQTHIAALHNNTDHLIQHLDLVMARFPWVQMVVFSELAVTGPLTRMAEPMPGPSEQRLCEAAARHGVWLIPGSLFEQATDGKIYNTAPVIDPLGNVIARYRKMFPFRPYEQGVEAGRDFCIFDVAGVGRFGLSICYDMWFPETTRQMTAQGVEVLLHPVLTGTIDRDVELAIARATAAQFQCYIFDVNGLAAGGVGRSCVVDPSGTVISQAHGQEEYLAVEIDLARVRRQREIGLNGLGQPLKSFRDREVDFSVYDRASGVDAFLGTLGPLKVPARGSLDGIGVAAPSNPLHVPPPPAPAPAAAPAPVAAPEPAAAPVTDAAPAADPAGGTGATPAGSPADTVLPSAPPIY